jgi:hypothetical protein
MEIKKMKAYRKPELTLPEPFEPVLVHNDESGIATLPTTMTAIGSKPTPANKSTAFATGCLFPFYHTNEKPY